MAAGGEPSGRRSRGQRPAGPDQADAPGLGDRAGDDAGVGLPRADQPRTVRPDQLHARQRLEVAAHPHHVERRDPLGDRDDQPDPGLRGLDDGVGRERGRHVDHRGLRAGLAHRVAQRDQHQQRRQREHRAEHERERLVERRVDAERLRGVLVLADGLQVVAHLRALEPDRDQHHRHRHTATCRVQPGPNTRNPRRGAGHFAHDAPGADAAGAVRQRPPGNRHQ